MTPHIEIDNAVSAAQAAAPHWAKSDGPRRADLLNALATGLEAERAELVALADRETKLGLPRLNGELDRTCFQLRRFADYARDGGPFACHADPAVAGPPPQGRPQITRVRVPLGPVAMFSASNFPFAFSVLGGDTASALAAGCPVVVKAHPAHPLLSRAVHQLTLRVLASLDLPAGLVGHIDEDSFEAGMALVAHPGIRAVAFTGSLSGGQALSKQAASRPRPIPFYGELGSINPVVVLPGALEQSLDEKARLLAGSVTQGAGQFCTSPGLVLMLDTPESHAFARALAREVAAVVLHPMLSPRISEGYKAGVRSLAAEDSVEVLAEPGWEHEKSSGFVGVTSASAFLDKERLRHEVFGSSCLCVLAKSMAQIHAVLEEVAGSLTVTLWGAEEESAENRLLLRTAQSIAGRVLFKGVPTGVAVTPAQHHGGPWPASTQALFTSVGLAAADRFLRPLALQDAPDWVSQSQGVPA
ncbi:MAG TPA: aldehyde dehydrogenase (NADP(+)) [Polaromonas sp.]|uniref:aldehyde dehydrogenase (NADP(+)) n=1 Tax=Polaromonas sp. TaxID=1869339 RepID=UPI002D5870A9|nr:aldehyde dehydrogenase (NADP(+)) [Polaromonas sp.]HYW55348.1 aldehyde dehydrogenase (NADP(+)) [Polaromonas sp.]